MAAPNPRTLTQLEALAEAGLVSPAQALELARVTERYAIALPPALAALIDPTDPADPIARQFLPDPRELDRSPDELDDPIGDDLKSPVNGIVHRYPRPRAAEACLGLRGLLPLLLPARDGRARRGGARRGGFRAALDYIAAHPEIWEVVLTGGDPLALSPRRIADVTRALAEIPHVKILRWHTRLPVAAPERVTPALARALVSGHDKTVYVALHANHPRELTRQARAACRRLIDHGVADGQPERAAARRQRRRRHAGGADARVRRDARQALLSSPRRPRPRHRASAHFDRRGTGAMRELRRRLSGLALPAYMLDIPGARGKVPLGPAYVEARGDGYEVTDPAGDIVAYGRPI